MDSKLEGQKENWHIDRLTLADLQDFQLARVGIRDCLLRLATFSHSISLRFVLLSLATTSWLGVFLRLLRFLVLFVDNLDVENNILWKRIMEFNVNLARLIKLGGLVYCVN